MTDPPELHQLLEFDKIIEQVKLFSLSQMAAEKLDSLAFMTTIPEIEKELTQVSELRAILDFDDPMPLHDIWDVRKDLEIVSVAGNYLKVDALVRVVQNLTTSRRIRAYLKKRNDKYPNLWRIAESIAIYAAIEKEIGAKIDLPNFEIRDSASPKLASIRKKIKKAAAGIRKAVDALFKTYSGRGYLQEDLVTLKDGRLVFPVKLEHRGKVKGLVHDQSASGSTLFIEPLDSIELNNEISALKGEETLEIERILKELAGLIRQDLVGIRQNFERVAQIDFIQSKAAFSKQLNCNQPALNAKGVVDIKNGKHPLLLLREEKPESIVPLEIKIGLEFNTLVITGPNAGGKTVALKTVGLFALMIQSGIPIPADPDSTMPVFEDIFADIGDFQSIENDLSTFSSHIKKMQAILKKAGEKSLVLMDEIGVGTDPEEGAALAVALLEELTQRECRTIVTTHHGALKAFAYDAPGVENGSMEFDIETLQPAYKFRVGIPGSSYALEISKRLGISEKILKRSRVLIGAEKGKLEHLILELEKRVQASQKTTEELEIEKNRLEGLTNLYKKQVERLKKDEKKFKEKALEESQNILKNSNALIENAIKEIRESHADRETISRIKQTVASEKKKIAEEITAIESASPENSENEKAEIEIGAEVFWQNQNKTGKIVSIQAGSGKVLLQVENFKFQVAASELFKLKGKRPKNRRASPVKIQTEEKTGVLPEIHVRGQTLDEAIMNVDKFLDDALLAGWNQVRIIHGKGTGALRKGISDFLRKQPRVKSTKMGAWNEGDIGVTVVELD